MIHMKDPSNHIIYDKNAMEDDGISTTLDEDAKMDSYQAEVPSAGDRVVPPAVPRAADGGAPCAQSVKDYAGWTQKQGDKLNDGILLQRRIRQCSQEACNGIFEKNITFSIKFWERSNLSG